MMVKINALTSDGEGYLYGNSLFCGVGFEVGSNGRLTPLHISDGKVLGIYDFGFLPAENPGIDISGFTEDDVDGYPEKNINHSFGLSYSRVGIQLHLHLNGVPYTGVAYEFEGNNCIRALSYLNGALIVDAEWDKSGIMKSLVIEGELSQYYSWHSNGELKSADVSQGHISSDRGAVIDLRVMLRFSSEKILSSISLEGDLSSLEIMIAQAKFFPVKRIGELKKYRLSNNLIFFGNVINHREFINLIG